MFLFFNRINPYNGRIGMEREEIIVLDEGIDLENAEFDKCCATTSAAVR